MLSATNGIEDGLGGDGLAGMGEIFNETEAKVTELFAFGFKVID